MKYFFYIYIFFLINFLVYCKKRKCICGKFAATVKPHIVNGVESKPHGFPFIVAIVENTNGLTSLPFCTGSIIHPQWILTAAHCFPTLSKTQVLFGTNLRSGFSKTHVVDVQKIFIHEKFNKTRFLSHDLALLFLKVPLPISNQVNRICLRKTCPYTDALVSGFGKMKEGGDFPPKLRETFVKNRDSLCSKMYGRDFDPNLQTCAEYHQRSTCQGDSGGPLFAITSNAAYIVGVVSWAEGCARVNKPTVYTRVCNYAAWIARITKSLGCYIK